MALGTSAPGIALSCVKAACVTMFSERSRNFSSAPKKNRLSLTIGPPIEPPYSSRSNSAFWKVGSAAWRCFSKKSMLRVLSLR